MQITASQLRGNDLIRGIGLVVDQRILDSGAKVVVLGHTVDRETGSEFSTRVELPEDHRVNVRREFQVGDIVTVSVYAYTDDPWNDPAFEGFDGTNQYIERQVSLVDVERRLLHTVPLNVELEDSDDHFAVDFRQARHAAA